MLRSLAATLPALALASLEHLLPRSLAGCSMWSRPLSLHHLRVAVLVPVQVRVVSRPAALIASEFQWALVLTMLDCQLPRASLDSPCCRGQPASSSGSWTVRSSSFRTSSVSPSQCLARSAGSLCSSSSGASSVSPSQCLARSAGLLAQASECPASTPPSHPPESTSASLGGCQAHSWRPQISSSICTTLWGPPSSPATEPACTPRQPPCTQLSYGRMGRWWSSPNLWWLTQIPWGWPKCFMADPGFWQLIQVFCGWHK